MRPPRLAKTVLFLVVVLATAVAGCGKPDSGPQLNAVEKAIAQQPGKVLHGHVLSDEVVPLVATVELLDGGSNATTAQDGSFLFAGLESRDYLIKATAPGYYPEVQRAAMMLGRDFKLDFYLRPIPTGEPQHGVQFFDGFISCQAVLAMDFPGWIRQDCGTADPNNKRSHQFTFTEHSSGFVVELFWEPTNACAATLDFGLYLLLENGAAHALDERFAKPGERIYIPPAYFAPNRATGGIINAGIAAERCSGIGGPGLGAGFVVQQPVDVYFTAFYFQDVPADYSVKNG